MSVTARRTAGAWLPVRRRVAGHAPRFALWRWARARVTLLRLPWWRFLVPAITLPVMAAGLVTLYNQPMFRIAEVQVRGIESVSAQAVLDAARLEGRHILDVSDRAIATSLAAIPQIKSVTVNRWLPNGVELVLEERKPWAVWQTGNRNYLIDNEGVVLEASAQARPALPVVVYGGAAQLKPGARVPPEPVKLAVALDRALPELVKVKAKRFEYSENGGLLVITDGGWQARFGDGEDLEYKLATLKAIVETARARKIPFTAVDLRFGARPFIR